MRYLQRYYKGKEINLQGKEAKPMHSSEYAEIHIATGIHLAGKMETTADLTRIQEATHGDSQSLHVGVGGSHAPSKEKLLVFVQMALLLNFTGIIGLILISS